MSKATKKATVTIAIRDGEKPGQIHASADFDPPMDGPAKKRAKPTMAQLVGLACLQYITRGAGLGSASDPPAATQSEPKTLGPACEENAALRDILSKCAAAIGNGSFALPTCSVEFFSRLPEEIRHEMAARTKAGG